MRNIVSCFSKCLFLLTALLFLQSCGDSGGQISKGHRDAIKKQCENSSDPKGCALELRKRFLDDGNEFVILDDGELNKEQIRKIKMDCITSKEFGLETYNNCLNKLKSRALNNDLFNTEDFAERPKSNIENLERHTVRLSIVEVISEDEFKGLGEGSGVIINNNLIATNCHVTSVSKKNDKTVIFIKNINQENYDLAKIYKEAPEHDICIIKKENMSEFALKMNAVKKFVKFDDLRRGDFVRSLGTPEGMEGHSAKGEIQYLGTAAETAHGLDYSKDTKIINHSADIAPGSSGGPLFDKDGNLIGLNTFGNDKFNFAVSADHINELMKK